MGVQIYRDYMVTCDKPGCSDFVDYGYTPVEYPYAKDMYKMWREMGWRKYSSGWYCPEHANAKEVSDE